MSSYQVVWDKDFPAKRFNNSQTGDKWKELRLALDTLEIDGSQIVTFVFADQDELRRAQTEVNNYGKLQKMKENEWVYETASDPDDPQRKTLCVRRVSLENRSRMSVAQSAKSANSFRRTDLLEIVSKLNVGGVGEYDTPDYLGCKRSIETFANKRDIQFKIAKTDTGIVFWRLK